MYEYIKGVVSEFGKDYIVLENGNIGYKIFTSNTTMTNYSDSTNQVKMYTKLIVREDDIFLCGFSSFDELQVFNLITSVSGVGVKVGLAMLSSFDYKYLISIIFESDIKSLTKAPGIGKKTAERLVLELKDKIKKIYGDDIAIIGKNTVKENILTEEAEDAVNALISLGYSKNESKKVVGEFKGDINNIEEIIKFALVKLSRY